jgi:phage repressor protein C with HTH and peptisase S24 domain
MANRQPILKHADLWRAIDELAAKHEMSTSGLARQAGLDPTSFNMSKRVSDDGKRRWPSTASLAKILNATDTPFSTFAALIEREYPAGRERRLPALPATTAETDGHFDAEGRPLAAGWDEVLFPNLADPDCYLLEIDGKRWEPAYRDGDQLVVSPGEVPRRGDRVVARTAEGSFVFGQLRRRSERTILLAALDPGGESLTLDPKQVAWMSRIVWASQ